MITTKQKEVIIKKLIAKHNAMRDVVVQLGDSMMNAYNKYAVSGFDFLAKYGTDKAFKTACDNVRRNICGTHYASVFCSSSAQYIACYIGNNKSDSFVGVPMLVGWTFVEDKPKTIVYTIDEQLTLKIFGYYYTDIRAFVNNNADTNAKAILDFSKKLDMDWKNELTAFVEEVINKWAKVYADALSEAKKREGENDSMLLSEFGMSPDVKVAKAKKFKVTIKEVK